MKTSPASPVYSFVDLETTGGSFEGDRIMEVGVVQVQDGLIIHEWESLINPQRHIPPMIESLTGISPYMVEDAPLFEEIALQLHELLKGTLFVAHNVQFDYGFLQASFRRMDMDFNLRKVCTVRASRHFNRHLKTHRLDSLIEAFDLRMDDRHRALSDAKAIAELYQKMKAVHGDAIDDYFRERSKSLPLPPQLDENLVKELPERPGVYIFYGSSDFPLYIGKSKNIKTRVKSHFTASSTGSRAQKIFKGITHIESQTTAGELGALLLESQLIKTLKPLHNRQLRRVKELTLAVEIEEDGFKRLRLTFDPIESQSAFSQILGVFDSKQKASLRLRDLAKRHQLCPDFLFGKNDGKSCLSFEMGYCLGACMKRESAESYNARFEEAFKTERLHDWPFKEYWMIQEPRGLHEGDLFVFKDWRLVAEGRYDSDFSSLNPLSESSFDKDTYKILRSHLKSGKARGRSLSDEDYRQLISE